MLFHLTATTSPTLKGRKGGVASREVSLQLPLWSHAVLGVLPEVVFVYFWG